MLSRAEYTRRVAILLAMLLGIIVAWKIAAVLLLGFGGVVFAVVVRSAGDALSRRLPISVHMASAVVLVVLFALAAVGAWLLGDTLVAQLEELRRSLPQVLTRTRDALADTRFGRAVLSTLGDSTSSEMWTGMAVRFVSSSFAAITYVLIVLFLAVYLSLDPRSYMNAFLVLVPRRHREPVRAALYSAAEALRCWVIGQLVAMTFVGLLTWLGLWLVGVPNALVLGLIAGLLDFVPVLGPFAAALPGVLLAYASSPELALYAAIVYFVVQQLEAALIMPLAQKWAVELPPAIGLLAVVVFGAVFGIPGVLFGVPLAVVVMTLVRCLYVDHQPPLEDAQAAGDAPAG